MPNILRLSDGSTTLDLLDGVAYSVPPGGVDFGHPSVNVAVGGVSLLSDGGYLNAISYGPRSVVIRLYSLATAIGTLRSNVQAVNFMLEKAQARQKKGFGTAVVLQTQLGGTAAGSNISFEVLYGTLRVPSSVYNRAIVDSTRVGHRSDPMVLELVTQPFATGTQITATATLRNEQSAAGTNYWDSGTLTGDSEAPNQITVAFTSATGTVITWVWKRSGSRRTDTLWRQGESFDSVTRIITTGNTSTFSTSTGTAVGFSPSGTTNFARIQLLGDAGSVGTWVGDVGRWNFTLSGPPQGLFRVLSRVQYSTTGSGPTGTDGRFGVGFSYGAISEDSTGGGRTYTTATSTGTPQVLDLGEVRIPPINVATGQTLGTYELRIFSNVRVANAINSTSTWQFDLDYVALMAIDEGAVIGSAVSATNTLLGDSISAPPGVYLLDTNGSLTDVPTYTGGPFMLGPEDSRVYVLRDDAPTATLNLTVKYNPRYRTV